MIVPAIIEMLISKIEGGIGSISAGTVEARPPSSLVDWVARAIESNLPASDPNFVYFTWALTAYAGAFLAVLAMRGGLRRDWTAIGDWDDRIVLVISSTASNQRNAIDRCHIGQLTVMKGRTLLNWPDEAARALANLNHSVIAVAAQGRRCLTWSKLLTGPLTFTTMFILQSALAWLFWITDSAARAKLGYQPKQLLWLGLIFLWPAAVYVFQHIILPDWWQQLDTAETNMKKLSRQFAFKSARLI